MPLSDACGCVCWCFRGKLRRQNEKAHLIGHVKDVGVDSKHENPATRIYLTSVAQPWHVDGVDVVGESSVWSWAVVMHCHTLNNY